MAPAGSRGRTIFTAHSAVLLDPSDAVARFDVGARLTRPGRRPALVIQPRRGRPAGALVEALLAHGLDPAVIPSGDGDLADPGAAPLAIIARPDSLTQASIGGRLEPELEWIRRADEAGTAVLGIGHGARALALAFGGSAEPAEHPLRGWAMVDTVVPHVVATGPWLAWQHDVITLPDAALPLAGNRLGPQAFRIGRHLEVQFHPEAAPEDLAAWAGATGAHAEARSLTGLVTRDRALRCARNACSRRSSPASGVTVKVAS